ncbi:MAG: C-terminal target protein [Segetibacter sp.]|nr:C-terminal target protein [Segetibacter sp.]
MKKITLPIFAIAAIFSNDASAQNKAYAVTSQVKGSYNWNVIREIDLGTGEVVKTIFDPAQTTIQPLDALTKTAINFGGNSRFPAAASQPMNSGVAAAAFDAKFNRLYYTNMRGDELRYFDLNSNQTQLFYLQGQTLAGGNKYDEANVITRMSFASDGFGYALTNDAKHLVRFSTGQKPVISDLGELIDGKNNKGMSVHKQCSSWGGDMVGDAYGNLYLISMRNNIFKINVQTKVADFIGTVKGLPEGFTSNGMVVNNDGDVVVSSATLSDNYFKVNISTLEATQLKKTEQQVYNASDLANGNLLYSKSNFGTEKLLVNEIRGNHAVSIYPNPVANKTFTVQFDRVAAGQYNLVLTDASGRNVLSRALNIAVSGQQERINLPRTAAGGMYLIKLTGSDRQTVYNDKIVVQ